METNGEDNQRKKRERKRKSAGVHSAIKASSISVDSPLTFVDNFVYIALARYDIMLSSRAIFICVSLCLAMTVSSVPVKDDDFDMFAATESSIDEVNTFESATGASKIDDAKLLFRNASRVFIGSDVKFNGELLFDQINATYKTPAIDDSQAIRLKFVNDSVSQSE